MKKTNPFKFYSIIVGSFIFFLILVIAIIGSIVNYNNSKEPPTYSSIRELRNHVDLPYYDMYDIYEYLNNDKNILLSEKQDYQIVYFENAKTVSIIDYGIPAKINAMYGIQYKKTGYIEKESYTYYHDNDNSELYIKFYDDEPKNINLLWVSHYRDWSYDILVKLDNDISDRDSFINKIIDYVNMVQKLNK